jgi:large subunit ribosomal protein L19
MAEEENTTETTEAAESAPVSTERFGLTLNGGAVTTSLPLQGAIKKWADFNVGDVIKVQYRIKEGDKERVQAYEGSVISIRGDGFNKTFIVRRISHDVGVERIFPYHTPAIQKIEVVRRGRVRRAKLFYLRGKTGKESRIKEAVNTDRPTTTVRKKAASAVKKKTSSTAKKGSKSKSTAKSGAGA